MNVSLLKVKGTWQDVKNACMTTIGKGEGKEPSSLWRRKILLSEHSPIRKLILSWKWQNLKYWVSVHFVRHKFGIEHWVSTQRDDRTGEDRDSKPQSSLVIHEAEANAQAIITMSRKRLCNQASIDTREAWKAFLDTFKDTEPELHGVCVPDCVYRGHCYEFVSCGYHKTDKFKEQLAEYRKGINEQ